MQRAQQREENRRLHNVEAALMGFAINDFSDLEKVEVTGKSDPIDVVSLATVMLGEELRALHPWHPYFSLLFGDHPDMVFVIGAEGRILLANQRVYSRLCYVANSLSRVRFAQLTSPSGNGEPPIDFGQPPAGGQRTAHLPAVLHDSEGKAIEVDLQVTAFMSSDGIGEYLVVAREVSLELAREWLSHAARATMNPAHQRRLQAARRVLLERAEVNQAIEQYGLTAKDLDIIQCMSEGLNSKEMAERFGTSHKTVATQRDRLYYKLQVFKDTALVQRANDLGLIGRYEY